MKNSNKDFYIHSYKYKQNTGLETRHWDITLEDRKELTSILDDTLICTRDWSAWDYKTMPDEDFVNLVDSERMDNLLSWIEALLAKKIEEVRIETVENYQKRFRKIFEDAYDKRHGWFFITDEMLITSKRQDLETLI